MEQKFKTTILFLIPVFLLFASDGIFSIQSILPLILITFLYDCCFGGMKINQQEIMVVVLYMLVSMIALLHNMFISPKLITNQSFVRVLYYLVILLFYFSMTHVKYTQHSIIIKGGIGLNTNDEKIQWHPAFDAALQIEFGDEAKYLEFDPEHLISKKPMQIDVLVKNEKHVKLRKNIGRIFRQYNIIEYKSPEDDLDIDDFYKTYAYACLYKSDTETVDLIPADELTITFVCYHYPRNMLRKLEQDRKFSVEQQDSGIYYLIGDAIPIQLVIVPKLSKEHNYWLNNLRNRN